MKRIALLLPLLLLMVGCGTTTRVAPTPISPTASSTAHARCVATHGLPDAHCTPGDVFSGVSSQKICVAGYTKTVRNVPASEKTQVFAEYSITQQTPGQFEIDHLIPLELGGSNALTNLWPEAASPVPGFHQKDQLENYLHDKVCSGVLSLQTAQHEIATNWIGAYDAMRSSH